MEIPILKLKSEMVKNGITMIDFLENNFKVSYADPNLIISKVFLAEEKHICRPDMISYDGYASVNYTDGILKFNQITNPFSIEINDFIIIPDLASLIRFYREDKLITSNGVADTKSLFIDPTKASQKDLARLQQLQKIANRRANGSSEIKPTNLLRKGEVPFKTDGNQVIFAPSISTLSKTSQVTN